MKKEDQSYEFREDQEIGEGSILDQVKGKDLFSTPENYFEQLTLSLKDKQEVIEELKKESSLLADIQDKQVFVVPRNYESEFFEKLGNKIDNLEKEHIDSKKVSTATIIPLRKWKFYAVALAACLCLWFGFRYLFYDKGGMIEEGIAEFSWVEGVEEIDSMSAEVLFASIDWREYDLDMISAVFTDVDWEESSFISEELINEDQLEEALEELDWSTVDLYDLEEEIGQK